MGFCSSVSETQRDIFKLWISASRLHFDSGIKFTVWGHPSQKVIKKQEKETTGRKTWILTSWRHTYCTVASARLSQECTLTNTFHTHSSLTSISNWEALAIIAQHLRLRTTLQEQSSKCTLQPITSQQRRRLTHISAWLALRRRGTEDGQLLRMSKMSWDESLRKRRSGVKNTGSNNDGHIVTTRSCTIFYRRLLRQQHVQQQNLNRKRWRRMHCSS